MASIGRLFKTKMVARAVADSTISDLIGNRLWAVKGKQRGAAPYVVWQTVSANGNYAHDGSTGLETFRIQFSIFASTLDECEQIRDAFKDSFEGGPRVWDNSVRVGFCFLENEIDVDNDLSELKQKMIDFRFMASLP